MISSPPSVRTAAQGQSLLWERRALRPAGDSPASSLLKGRVMKEASSVRKLAPSPSLGRMPPGPPSWFQPHPHPQGSLPELCSPGIRTRWWRSLPAGWTRGPRRNVRPEQTWREWPLSGGAERDPSTSSSPEAAPPTLGNQPDLTSSTHSGASSWWGGGHRRWGGPHSRSLWHCAVPQRSPRTSRPAF